MEKIGYREALGMLREMFPGRATLNVKEVATALGISEWSVYESMKRLKNSLPSVKVGGKILVPITALARWMCCVQ